MRIRRAVLTAGAVALLATAMQPAHAADTVDYDVGGGVAAVQVEVNVYKSDLRSLPTRKDTIRYANAVQTLTMGHNGGNYTRALVNQRVSTLARVQGGLVSIRGKRSGDPFAEGRTILTGVTIQGTTIRAIEATCNWTNGVDPSGTVTITDANGQSFAPEPNTEIPIPGVGTLYLNEQFVDGVYIYNDAGGYSYQQVIYVYGARLHVEGNVLNPLVDNAESDIILGFTSCDPINLPNLSGLRLTNTSS